MKKNIEKAREIIKIVQKKLMYEDSAVIELFELLKPVAVANDILLESDGDNLFFNADNIIGCYKLHMLQDLERRYMHILLHGILGHFTERKGYMNDEVIDMVLDFQVESVRKALKTKKIPDIDNCRVMYEKIKRKRRLMSDEVVKKIHQDEHSLWETENKLNMLEEQNSVSSDEANKKWKDACERLSFENSSMLSEVCKKIMESKDEKHHGINSCKKGMVCSAKGQPIGDYYNILKDFFFEKEGINEDVNAIDKILYSYGFENYGNIALVEPDEENVRKALHNIVIALDTSLSCQEYIERFLVETKEIFGKLADGIGFETIYIMQADADIVNEKQYKNVEEILTKLEGNYMTYGFGGTDFRPVFKRCSELNKEGKIIDCLIYFSDEEGSFPTSKPKSYETFFVVPCVNNYESNVIPKWVKKISIQL